MELRTDRIVFFGTPPFAVTSLEAILQSGRRVPLVITQPDRPAGRGRRLRASAVKEFCKAEGIPWLQPVKLKAKDFLAELAKTGSHLFVVAAYGRILPVSLLNLAKLTLNVHASLLPRWRGAAPIERAIMAGDGKTGISIIRLVEELDAGDVLGQKETTIPENETAGELRQRLADLGGEALVEALDLIEQGKAKFVPQESKLVTYAPRLEKAEGKISWNQRAEVIHNLIRGLNPQPGAFTRDGRQRIKIFRTKVMSAPHQDSSPGSLLEKNGSLMVVCKDSWLEVLELQREGKARQNVEAFLAGYPISRVSKWI